MNSMVNGHFRPFFCEKMSDACCVTAYPEHTPSSGDKKNMYVFSLSHKIILSRGRDRAGRENVSETVLCLSPFADSQGSLKYI